MEENRIQVNQSAEEGAAADILTKQGGAEGTAAQEHLKSEKARRLAHDKAQKTKRRNRILIITAAVLVTALILALVIPPLTRNKADKMSSAVITQTSIKSSINASGIPVNLEIAMTTSDLITSDGMTRKLEASYEDEEDGEVVKTVYTVLRINDSVCNQLIKDIPNDTVLMVLAKGTVKDIASEVDGGAVEIVELTMGDFVDVDRFSEIAGGFFGASAAALIGEDEIDEMIYKAVLGTKFGHFYVSGNLSSAVYGTGSKLFSLSNRSMVKIELALGQHDAYKIMSAQRALAEDGDSETTNVTATVEFSTPWGRLEGVVQNGIEPILSTGSSSGVGTGSYKVVVTVEIPLFSSSGINVDTYLPYSSVTVSVQTGSASGLCVPVNAIFTEDGRDFVLVRKGKNNLQRVYVNVIISNGVSAIITADADGNSADVSALIDEGVEVFYEKKDSILDVLG